jgi:hypothetical protein
MGSDMDELRQSALEEEEVIDAYENYLVREVHSDKMFGMTAVERMFVSIGCFLLSSVGGFFLLLVMGKMAL